MNGAVICVEPHVFQGSLADPLYHALARYLAEVERIRRELADIIFLGKFHDDQGALVTAIEQAAARPVTGRAEQPAAGDMPGATVPAGPAPAGALHYRVHEHAETGRRAIVVINDSDRPAWYRWEFTTRPVAQAYLYRPFHEVALVSGDVLQEIEPEGLHIWVEPEPS
jgi:hypothetical protein